MRRSLLAWSLLLLLLGIVCLSQQPRAFYQSRDSNYNIAISGGGGSYTGPADVVASPTACWSLRACSSATRGNKSVNLCIGPSGSDTACADFTTDATTGNIAASPTISGSACTQTVTSGTYNSGTGAVVLTTSGTSLYASAGFVAPILTGTGSVASIVGKFTAFSITSNSVTFTAATGLGSITITGGVVGACSVKTLYDQIGVNDQTNNDTMGTRGILVSSALNSLSVIVYPNSYSASVSISQPYSFSTVAERVDRFTAQNYAVGTFGFGWDSSTNTGFIYAGASVDFTAADSTWTAFQAIFNGSSSISDVNGTANTSLNPSTGALSTVDLGSYSGVTAFCSCNFTELVLWPLALNSTQYGNLTSNQRAFWSF